MNSAKWIERQRRFHDLPLEWTPYQVWEHDLKMRPAMDFDTLCLVTGSVRKGKSTCAQKVAKRVDPTFETEWRNRIAFGWGELCDIILEFPRGEELEPGEVRVAIWDEIIEGGMSREAMTKDNREMQKFFTVSGERNACVFALAPHINNFDSSIRDSRATDWCVIPRRGIVKGHVRKDGGDYPGRKKSWDDIFLKRFTKDSSPQFKAYEHFKADASRRKFGADGSTGGTSGGFRVDPNYTLSALNGD